MYVNAFGIDFKYDDNVFSRGEVSEWERERERETVVVDDVKPIVTFWLVSLR